MALTAEQKQLLEHAKSVHGPRCKAIGARGGVFLIVRPPLNEDRASFNEAVARAGNRVNANVVLSKACVVYPVDKAKVKLFEDFPFLPESVKKVVLEVGGSEIEEVTDASLSDTEKPTLQECRAKHPECVPVRCLPSGELLIVRRANPSERTRFSQATKGSKNSKMPDQTIGYEQLARSLTLSPEGNAKTELFDKLPFLYEAIGDFGIAMSGAEIEDLGND
ncbi:MAG: hypothetical protein ABFD89_17705 [Bryobacteraceae bacterium]